MNTKAFTLQKTTWAILIISGIIYGSSLIFWLLLAGLLLLSYTTTDAPIVYGTLFLYPFLALISLFAGYIFYARKRFVLTIFVLAIPFIWGIIALASYMTLWFG